MNFLKQTFLALLLIGISVNADLQAMKRDRDEAPPQQEGQKLGERTGKAPRKQETEDSATTQDPTILPLKRIIDGPEFLIFEIEGANATVKINKKNIVINYDADTKLCEVTDTSADTMIRFRSSDVEYKRLLELLESGSRIESQEACPLQSSQRTTVRSDGTIVNGEDL